MLLMKTEIHKFEIKIMDRVQILPNFVPKLRLGPLGQSEYIEKIEIEIKSMSGMTTERSVQIDFEEDDEEDRATIISR